MASEVMRIPHWAKVRIPGGPQYSQVKKAVNRLSLHTVCAEARCPNAGECHGAGTAAFLILGDLCTRHCAYCAVKHGIPEPPDPTEPGRIAGAVAELGLRHAVITSVTRDDLADGGASFFAATVSSIRICNPSCGVEVLVPDFRGSMERSLEAVAASGPDVLNHNIEVVRGHFPRLRPQGDYTASLRLLRRGSNLGQSVKSGFMVGFGESFDDIAATLRDLAEAGCARVTVGQYLRSRRENHAVAKYYHPDEFERIASMAKGAGIGMVQSAPLVRSSYHAGAAAGCG